VKMEEFMVRRLSERLDNLSDEFWAHYDESSEKREKIAKRLEEASHELQFCEDAADVASILVDLFNEIAEMLKE